MIESKFGGLKMKDRSMLIVHFMYYLILVVAVVLLARGVYNSISAASKVTQERVAKVKVTL